mmetsp:Transcript_15640/g.36620  ORF Transcript_15640/g.36620 Transcript_15640/m.36620 type:complete len:462 (-) Transcript_15640:268-1653(-)|eukprot:CAMPEP_0178405280 /NCGR_PEP_ID=MMETSP0689_2-20121128/18318_1 /TAXON_ID=160604 /ORGANISM="Amphidinium massartii, Strain CS-259" /LENGTH=461 /DNA_ID=CAMNT_0020026291 /DNA_START=71 /DNA_END=1456 /DNA_ORIENTATION=-
MAPKAKNTRGSKKVSKKPAARKASATVQGKASAKAKAAATRKRPAAAPTAGSVSKKRRTIVSAIKGIEELPRDVREMLAGLVEQSVFGAPGGEVHPYHEAASTMVGDALADVEGKLRTLLDAARAKVDAAGSDKEARDAALQAAEDNIPVLKQAVQDKKSALTAGGKAIQAAQRDLHACKLEQKAAEATMKVHTKKMDHLQQTQQQSFGALRDAAASGAEGQKQLKTLRKVGKEFGFHEVLLDILPAVLKKVPDRRRTFDNFALQHLEAEFRKRAGGIETDIRNHQAELDAGQAAVQAAQDALQHAEERREAVAEELSAAEAALVAGRRSLTAARRQVRLFGSDAARTARELSKMEARYNAFATGPLAAFQDIRRTAGAAMEDAQPASEGAASGFRAAAASSKATAGVEPWGAKGADSPGATTIATTIPAAAADTLAEVVATLPQANVGRSSRKRAAGSTA